MNPEQYRRYLDLYELEDTMAHYSNFMNFIQTIYEHDGNYKGKCHPSCLACQKVYILKGAE